MNSPTTRLAAAVLALGLAPAAAAAAADANWHPDLGPALEKARAENKDLLVDFTGSDWCGWCIRLDKEVFSEQAFADYAKDNFVLVALDFPRAGGEVYEAMPAELRERNEQHQQAFGIQGFPTILLMSPDGVAYARTGYQAGGPEAYIEHLDELRAGDERAQMKTALERFRGKESTDEQRLEAAYELYGSVTPDLRAQVLDTVRRLDPKDARLILAREAVDGWRGRHLESGEQPDWAAMKSEATKLLESRPSIGRVAEFHLWLGFAHAMTDDLDKAQASLDEASKLDDGDNPVVAQMKPQLGAIIQAMRAGAGEPGGEGESGEG